MKLRIFKIQAICLLLSACSATCMAEDFSELKTKAFAIRNTDPQVEKPVEWNQVESELVSFLSRNPNSCEALFSLGNLCLDYANKRGDVEKWNCAKRYLAAVQTRCATTSLAPEALLALGNAEEARGEGPRSLEELIRRYPHSAAAAVAIQQKETATGEDERAALRTEDSGSTVIVIDPGHGGDDHGAASPSGLLEKDIALDISRRLEKALLSMGEYKVVLTREGDEFVPLAERTSLANELQANLFLSIHVNSSPSGKVSGIETYYLDNTEDKAAVKLAERENGGEGQEDLAFLISDLVQSSKLGQSKSYASNLQKQLVKDLTPAFSGLKDLGVKKGPFYVLTGAHMPCALVELFFVNNSNDASHLADPLFRQKIAEALARATLKSIVGK